MQQRPSLDDGRPTANVCLPASAVDIQLTEGCSSVPSVATTMVVAAEIVAGEWSPRSDQNARCGGRGGGGGCGGYN